MARFWIILWIVMVGINNKIQMVDDPTERLNELENDVFELKQHIQKSEEKL